MRHNKNCMNPIAMEAMDKETGEIFTGSKDFSGDGVASPENFNLYQGFKCTNAAQPNTPDGRPSCPDVKIRYLCLDGVVDIQGRIFTTFFDRVSSNEDNDANRLQHFPKLISEDGLMMGECNIFLKEDDDVHELDLPRVKINGDYGFIRCFANSSEPGLYNLTFNTQDNGNSMTDPRLYRHFANEDLTPFNFEVYPQIRSVSPQVGSRDGGTKITIEGTGFYTSFPQEDRQAKVEVGGVECTILEQTATRIVCQTQMTDALREKIDEMDNVRVQKEFEILEENIDVCPGLPILPAVQGVWSLDQCIERCRQVADCKAVVWRPSQGGQCSMRWPDCDLSDRRAVDENLQSAIVSNDFVSERESRNVLYLFQLIFYFFQ